VVVAWTSSLGEVGPAPEGEPLTVTVSCRTQRRGRGRRHDVVLHPDWTVETPHDLDAERIGVALGGHLSCVDLVDRTVPALRDLAQLAARRRLPPLGRNHAGRWVVDQPSVGCRCEQDSYATPFEAAEHVRDAGHLGRRYGANAAVLGELLSVVEAAHGGFAMCPPPGWSALQAVREPRGLDVLWGAGVPPDLVEHVQDALSPEGRPLPTTAYLGAAYRCEDLDWLVATVRRRPDQDVAVWAAWSYGNGDRAHPHLRGDWLELGVPRSVIDVLVEGGITIRLAEELAETTGRTVERAALVLAAWERAGCRPGPGDIAALDVLGVGDSYEPSAAVVEGIQRGTARFRVRPTRTQVAVLVGLAGTRAEAVRLIQQGIVAASDALTTLTGVVLWDTPGPANPGHADTGQTDSGQTDPGQTDTRRAAHG
jgi:hypothetical protein